MSNLALVRAVINDNEGEVAMLLQQRANVNELDARKMTALMTAYENRTQAGIVRMLLEHKANVNQVGKEGFTALMFACRKLRDVTTLLEYQADVNQADNRGNTALMWASQFGGDVNVVELLRAKANVNQTDKEGWTALSCACGYNQIACAVELLKNGADVNQVHNGWTALLRSIAGDNVHMVNLLLVRKADVNQPNKNGVTPLLFAATRGRSRAAGELVKHKADINQASCSGQTPFAVAVEKGDADMVCLLLQAGCAEATDSTLRKKAAQSNTDESVVTVLKGWEAVSKRLPSSICHCHLGAQTWWAIFQFCEKEVLAREALEKLMVENFKPVLFLKSLPDLEWMERKTIEREFFESWQWLKDLEREADGFVVI